MLAPELDARKVLRSGSAQDPSLEAPLSAEAGKYRELLALSNAALDEIVQGKFDRMYDQRFSELLREDIERFWLTSQLQQIQELYGKPTGYGKEQWWFQEEKNQGRVLVHSVKLVSYGDSVFKFIFTVQQRKPGVLRGFRWVAPRPPEPKLVESSTGRENETAAGLPIRDDYAAVKKVSRQCLQNLKAHKNCRAFFTGLLSGQLEEEEFESNFSELLKNAGDLKSVKPLRWELHASDFPARRILTIRNLIEHERGQVWYVFSVYKNDLEKFVGFQVRPVRIDDRTEHSVDPGP